MSTSSRAVVLASGGLDSTVTAALAKEDGCELHFLTINYGQRHVIEVERARQVGAAMGAAQHTVLQLDLRKIGGSALTGDDYPIVAGDQTRVSRERISVPKRQLQLQSHGVPDSDGERLKRRAVQ